MPSVTQPIHTAVRVLLRHVAEDPDVAHFRQRCERCGLVLEPARLPRAPYSVGEPVVSWRRGGEVLIARLRGENDALTPPRGWPIADCLDYAPRQPRAVCGSTRHVNCGCLLSTPTAGQADPLHLEAEARAVAAGERRGRGWGWWLVAGAAAMFLAGVIVGFCSGGRP